jgi:5-methylcytosine-specific restriction protein A
MPLKAVRICTCGKRVAYGVKCTCNVVREREYDRRRPTSTQRGYDGKWRTESKAFLARPENRHCACGCGRLADMVDHIKPHRGDRRLFWSRSNWQPMASSPCHSSRKQSIERKAVRS